MIKIKVPATSANLGPGFDTLGIAFTLYNEFKFEKAKAFRMIDFEPRYSKPSSNLVCKSYKEAFKYLNLTPLPVKIYMLSEEVPTSRGLGSSATCIVAGVLAAKYFLGDKLSYDDAFQIASKIEGHPDNIAPAMFGSLVSSYMVKDSYKYFKYEVSNKLKFNVLVPPFELATHDSRKVLPKTLHYKDITFNSSRVCNIPYAFSLGDVSILKELIDDKMHEPFRMPLIRNSEEIKKIAHENGCTFSISGAGPCLLVISDKDVNNLFSKYSDWKILNLEVGHKGAIVEEL